MRSRCCRSWRRCRSVSCCRCRGRRWRRTPPLRAIDDFHRAQRRNTVAGIPACQPDPPYAVTVRGEVAPRSHKRRDRGTCCPTVSAHAVDVHLVRRVGRDSAPAHDQHFCTCPVIVRKCSRLPCGPRYGWYREDEVNRRVETEGVGGVHHQASLIIRCSSHEDEAIYGGCWRVHDPHRRVHPL